VQYLATPTTEVLHLVAVVGIAPLVKVQNKGPLNLWLALKATVPPTTDKSPIANNNILAFFISFCFFS
jgi:hypothetical protein